MGPQLLSNSSLCWKITPCETCPAWVACSPAEHGNDAFRILRGAAGRGHAALVSSRTPVWWKTVTRKYLWQQVSIRIPSPLALDLISGAALLESHVPDLVSGFGVGITWNLQAQTLGWGPEVLHGDSSQGMPPWSGTPISCSENLQKRPEESTPPGKDPRRRQILESHPDLLGLKF